MAAHRAAGNLSRPQLDRGIVGRSKAKPTAASINSASRPTGRKRHVMRTFVLASERRNR
jgi:hypothetical protein